MYIIFVSMISNDFHFFINEKLLLFMIFYTIFSIFVDIRKSFPISFNPNQDGPPATPILDGVHGIFSSYVTPIPGHTL